MHSTCEAFTDSISLHAVNVVCCVQQLQFRHCNHLVSLTLKLSLLILHQSQCPGLLDKSPMWLLQPSPLCWFRWICCFEPLILTPLDLHWSLLKALCKLNGTSCIYIRRQWAWRNISTWQLRNEIRLAHIIQILYSKLNLPEDAHAKTNLSLYGSSDNNRWQQLCIKFP